MAIAYHWETFTLKHNEYGPIKSLSLRDETVANIQMLEMFLWKDVFFQQVGLKLILNIELGS